jgi:hypothetical protein
VSPLRVAAVTESAAKLNRLMGPNRQVEFVEVTPRTYTIEFDPPFPPDQEAKRRRACVVAGDILDEAGIVTERIGWIPRDAVIV